MMLRGYKGRAKAFSVGNNMMNTSGGFSDLYTREMYIEDLSRFTRVFPRDPQSYEEIKALIGDDICQPGFDCAFLLKDAMTLSGLKTPDTRPLGEGSDRYFLHFFNRSRIEGTGEMIAEIERRYGLRGVSFEEWFALSGFSKSTPFKLKRRDFARLRRDIAGAEFVLTDVYHLSINCFNAATPVLCFGRSEAQDTPISDFKKRILFGMIGLSDNYVEMTDPDIGFMTEATVGFCDDFVAKRQLYLDGISALQPRLNAYAKGLAQEIFAA